MTAAITAADNGHDVVLFDKNEKLGKKLYITGKGRCNFTNASSPENHLKNVVTNPKFLFSAEKRFDSSDAISLMESAGVSMKVERGDRAFPTSDKSSDIIAGFSRLLKRAGVEVRLNEDVRSFVLVDQKIRSVVTTKGEYNVDAVVLATGGVSYSSTGSDGYGYKLAKSVGHSIVTPKASLVGANVSSVQGKKGVLPFENYRLQGISLKNVSISAFVDGKKAYEEFGEALFTEEGLSGPVVLTLSAYLNRFETNDITLSLDMKPALSLEKLDERIQRDIAEAPNKEVKSLLKGLLPSGLIGLYADASGIALDKKNHSVTKEERTRLCDVLKGLSFSISGWEPIERAVVTSGGIDVKEIDAKTMKSKLIDNLFFAGEIIDVDALTGGYNIQIALSTGYAAGSQL